MNARLIRRSNVLLLFASCFGARQLSRLPRNRRALRAIARTCSPRNSVRSFGCNGHTGGIALAAPLGRTFGNPDVGSLGFPSVQDGAAQSQVSLSATRLAQP